MHLVSRFWAWLSQLPPAETYNVVVEKGLKVPMPDGVTLLAELERLLTTAVKVTGGIARGRQRTDSTHAMC